MKKACRDQQCRRAGKPLALTEFPRNKNMKDERFSYCRECAIRRTQEYRERVKEKKAAQPKPVKVERKPMIAAQGYGLAFSKVYDAIISGKRTRKQIRAETKLDYDTIGECLCELLWEAGAVRIVNRKFVPIEEIHLAA